MPQEDDYPPHGYLDNATHTWILQPTGVLRSRMPLGFEWRAPKAARPTWVGGLQVLVQHSGRWLLDEEALRDAGLQPVARLHSIRRFLYELAIDDLLWQIEYVPISTDVLGLRLTIRNGGVEDQSPTFAIAASLEIDPEQSRRWSYRLAGGREGNALWLRPSAEGRGVRLEIDSKEELPHTLVPAASHLPDRIGSHSDSEVLESSPSLVGALGLRARLGAGETWRLDATLERGHWVSQPSPPGTRLSALAAARENAIAADEVFWSRAPRLEGDWPEHWRRGWVIDLETLRLSQRNPAGIFRTRWDAMQIQVPRFVLAETMLDMATFGFADPEAARGLVVGSLVDAAALGAQLPCLREDGSPNMVSRDGTVCGTSPAWCWPFLALEILVARGGELGWLGELLPVLEDYLDFWLRERCDQGGEPFYVCSWESGQDSSERFDRFQPTGGEDTRHVVPVDLIAGIAQAAGVLAKLKGWLGEDGARWRSVEAEVRAKLERRWTGRGYYDGVRNREEHLPIEDVTHLSPALLEGLEPAQREVLRHQLRQRISDGRPALEWASFFFQLCECGYRLQMPFEIAEAIAFNAERIWTAWDRRDWNGTGPMPGVALEHWALEGPRGGEGYGWGATMPLHLIRGIMGFRDEGDRLTLQPTLPVQLLQPKARYAIAPLVHRGGRWRLEVSVVEDDELEVTWQALEERAEQLVYGYQVDLTTLGREEGILRWRQPNGEAVHFTDDE